jgi:hypothetical protein
VNRERVEATGPAAEELFRFEGDFSSVRIDWLTAEVRRRMETAPVAARARARLFASFVEMTQNIIQYASPDGAGGPRRSGAIAFGRDPDGYWVRSRNPVRSTHAERLRARLERIRSMDPEEITAAYRARLTTSREVDPLSRGAGLGLLGIARSTGGALSYQLEPSTPSGGEPFMFSLHVAVRAAPGESA